MNYNESIAEQARALKTDFDEVYASGYSAGQSAGGDTDAAYQQGVADGKQAERNDFWDGYQKDYDGTERTGYFGAFIGWTDAIYNPTNRIYIGWSQFNLNYTWTFAYSYITNTKVPIVIASKTRNAKMFESSNVQTIPDISITATSYDSSAFAGIFYGATALKEVTFTSPIYVFLNFQWCEDLTKDTLCHIMGMLYDYAGNGQTGTYKLTFGSANLVKLTDEELSVARNKGWMVN